MQELRLEWVDPKTLTPNPANWRVHPPAQREALAGVLEEVGWAGALLWNEKSGRLVDGHLRLDVAMRENRDAVPVLIGSWSEAQEKEILATLDPIAAMAEADSAQLDALLREVSSGSAAVMDMLAGLAEGAGLYLDDKPIGAGGDEFDTTPLEGETRAKRGDLWQLGQHRLLVDDCTVKANVERLMGGEKAIAAITDPPYSVDYANQEREPGRVTRRMGGDTYSDPKNVGEFLKAFVANLPTDVLVMTYPVNKHFHELSDATRQFDMLYECVWVKSHFAFVIGRRYQPKHEPILIFRRKGGESVFNVPANQSTVFEYDKAAANPDHPTPRPVDMVQLLVEYHSDTGQSIYEPFCGSGTTLIACERTGRQCFALELMPQYADVILRRWEAETGKEAQLVERGTDE